MTQVNSRLKGDVANFRERILGDPTGVLDPEGEIHHEFVSGNHGRKLDFDKIEVGTDFYIDWVAIYARAVLATYPRRLPDALIGIANGANRLSTNVAQLLGGKVLGLTTIKQDAKSVTLDDEALEAIARNNVRFALTIEDVGTTGGTSATVVPGLREAGVVRIESMNFWQRNVSLPRLAALRIPHSAVILDPLPMFSPDACATEPDGYCAQGIALIEHSK